MLSGFQNCGISNERIDGRNSCIEPFEIPSHWTRIRSGDWGSARPFAFH
jgi:hypothetical protein